MYFLTRIYIPARLDLSSTTLLLAPWKVFAFIFLAMADTTSSTPAHATGDKIPVDEETKDANLSAVQSPTQITTSKSGADAALNLLKETGGVRRPIDAETNRRLLRKIDLHIMPLICIVYFLQYIDKTSISYASVTGIIQDTKLHGNQFNWVASIFFFGYV